MLLSVYTWSAADLFEKERKKRFTSIKHPIKWDEAAGMLCIIISLKGMGNIKRLSALILRWVAMNNEGDSFNYWHNHRALVPALHLYPPIPTEFIVLHVSFIVHSINTKAYRALKGQFTYKLKWSSFTHPLVIPNLYAVMFCWTQNVNFEEVFFSFHLNYSDIYIYKYINVVQTFFIS